MKAIKNLFLNEYFILGLIIVNAFVLFIEEFRWGLNGLEFVEATFTILFAVEMMVKISTYGFRKYIGNNWDRMDFTLVLLSLPSLSILFMDTNSIEINVILVLRVLRVFKFFRLIKFMPEIDSFVLSIGRALRASYIIIFAFFVLLFITSMISCSIYKDVAPEYFRNPITSFYAIFQLFTIEGWYEIPDLIAERTNETVAFFTKLYFSTMLLIGGILGFSLINSIFVDAMVADNNDDLEQDIRELTQRIHTLEDKIDRLIDQNNDK